MLLNTNGCQRNFCFKFRTMVASLFYTDFCYWQQNVGMTLVKGELVVAEDNRQGCYLSGVVVLKNGKNLEFKCEGSSSCLGAFGYLRYEFPDPVTGKLSKQAISLSKVKSIRLKSINGSMMVDSKGNIYPPDYQFSPYSAEKLVSQRGVN